MITYKSDSNKIFVRQSRSDYDAVGSNNDSKINIRQVEHLPSELFQKKLHDAYENLLLNEKDFLLEKGVRIRGICTAADIPGHLSENTLGMYDPATRTIYLTEKILYNNRWITHSNLNYTFKHEVGHAVNDLLSNDDKLVSDSKAFREAYNKDVSRLSNWQFKNLKLPNKQPWHDRDEVFARLYAYAAGLSSIHDNSDKMGQYFPQCLRYMKEFEL